jgi:hypothetical protein
MRIRLVNRTPSKFASGAGPGSRFKVPYLFDVVVMSTVRW